MGQNNNSELKELGEDRRWEQEDWIWAGTKAYDGRINIWDHLMGCRTEVN